jgi:hypothetical protein
MFIYMLTAFAIFLKGQVLKKPMLQNHPQCPFLLTSRKIALQPYPPEAKANGALWGAARPLPE